MAPGKDPRPMNKHHLEPKARPSNNRRQRDKDEKASKEKGSVANWAANRLDKAHQSFKPQLNQSSFSMEGYKIPRRKKQSGPSDWKDDDRKPAAATKKRDDLVGLCADDDETATEPDESPRHTSPQQAPTNLDHIRLALERKRLEMSKQDEGTSRPKMSSLFGQIPRVKKQPPTEPDDSPRHTTVKIFSQQGSLESSTGILSQPGAICGRPNLFHRDETTPPTATTKRQKKRLASSYTSSSDGRSTPSNSQESASKAMDVVNMLEDDIVVSPTKKRERMGVARQLLDSAKKAANSALSYLPGLGSSEFSLRLNKVKITSSPGRSSAGTKRSLDSTDDSTKVVRAQRHVKPKGKPITVGVSRSYPPFTGSIGTRRSLDSTDDSTKVLRAQRHDKPKGKPITVGVSRSYPPFAASVGTKRSRDSSTDGPTKQRPQLGQSSLGSGSGTVQSHLSQFDNGRYASHASGPLAETGHRLSEARSGTQQQDPLKQNDFPPRSNESNEAHRNQHNHSQESQQEPTNLELARIALEQKKLDMSKRDEGKSKAKMTSLFDKIPKRKGRPKQQAQDSPVVELSVAADYDADDDDSQCSVHSIFSQETVVASPCNSRSMDADHIESNAHYW